LGSGGTVTLGSGGTVTPGALGTVALGSGGTVTINGSGTITDGGTITQVSSAGGIYSIGSGCISALGSGGTVTLGSGGTVTLGSGGIVALGSGGTVALGSGGTVTLGSGGIVALGSGGTVTLGSGGTVTLGSGGTVTLGSGGVASGSGGTIALGSGGTVALGSGGTVALGSGGDVTLGSSGGTVTLGSGGTIALGSGGTIALGSGGTVTLGSGGTITLGSGGTPTVVGPGTYDFSAGGTITLGSGGTVALGSGGTVTLGSGGTITLGSGGTVTLGSGGTVTLGSGGTVTLGSGGIVALGSGGTIALGSGGTVALGSGGTIALGSGGIVALGSGGTVTLGSGGSLTTELTYQTANSIVRPPSNPTETPTQAGVRIDWTAPAFGVVASYTIYRSSNGATPIVLGTVTGNPPATEFLDTMPDTTSATVVYTIATNLAPVPIDPTTRQSAPSTPAVLKNDQTITLGSLPSSAIVSTQPTVTATAMSNGVANGLQVNFSTTGPCVITNQSITSGVSSATVTLNNTGSCTIIASQEGGTTYNAATSVSGSFPILPQTATQTITFTKAPPPSAAFNSSFTVAATGGASQNPVTFTSSGVCTVSGATYTMTSSTGTCTVIANQAGNSNYVAATPLTQNVSATGPIVTVSPSSINFGTVTLGSITTKNITVSNVGTAPVTINQPILSIVKGGNSNEFVAVNLCPTPLAAGKSCTITIAFVAGPFYTPQSATLEIMDNAPGSPQPVALSATVLIPQTITFTTNPPASAANKSSFTVAATGGASGNPVTFTSSGACSNVGATYTMTSGSGTCLVIANQAGNATYAAAAQVTKTVTATLTGQTITFTTNPPASAPYKSSFTVAATGGASGNAVKFTSSGACSNVGATYTMTSGTGACSVIANQAGNSSYAAAAQVTKTVNATQLAQTITFTTNPPASAAYKTSFTVAATGGASGNAVTFTSSGACSNSGATYTMTNGTGTCSVIANQAGNSNYAAAAQVTKTVTATYSLASLSPTSLSFGTVTSGKSSSPKTVTLSNTGTTPLIVSSIGFTGANPGNFVQTNTCPSSSSSLAAGKSCTISVTFKSSGKSASANLVVTENSQAGTQTVSLSGN
jgi:phosphotransferase system HPr-like phosphotransfer protein